ncbi:MAG: hypothetical protein AAF849_06665 [Bacteroidota bacterium]
MSVVFNLVTKYKNEESNIYSDLSETFTTFLSSKLLMYDNDELTQVEKLLNIDLSVLLIIRKNMSPDLSELKYQLRLAREAKNEIEVERIANEIKKVEHEWKEEYDKDTDGWVTIPKLREVVESFLGKISMYPNYYQKMKFNTSWGEYFYPDGSISNDSISSLARTEHTLINDLHRIIYYLDRVEDLGCEYVAFY